jgi:hypothetical protein
MVDNKQIIGIGILIITLLATGIVYIELTKKVRIRVDTDQTTFYVPNENYSWLWSVSGREINRLFNGSTILNRNLSSIKITTEINNFTKDVKIIRYTKYQRGHVLIDTYKFNGDLNDPSFFPISHTVEIYNASGLFYRYTIDDLSETGVKRKLSNEIFLTFGRNMKVELDPKYSWAWIGWPYGSDSVSAQYPIKENYEIFNSRLFDPSKESFNESNPIRTEGERVEDLIRNETYKESIRSRNTTETREGETKLYYTAERRIEIINNTNSTIIDLRLTTPYSMGGLIGGSETLVAEFYIGNFTRERGNIFDSIRFFDIGKGYREINRSYVLKYKTNRTTERCEEDGCYNLTIIDWREYRNLKDIPKGEIRVGMFADTKANEEVEWVGRIRGFDILEWANWNISSAVYTGNFINVSKYSASVTSIWLNSSGNKMYASESAGDRVHEFSLNVSWNISTATYIRNFSAASQDTNVRSVFFNNSGNAMYVLGATNDRVFEYQLSSPWNVSSSSYKGQNKLISAEDTTPEGLFISPTGTDMYFTGRLRNQIYQYTLSSPWNVSTAVYNNEKYNITLSIPNQIYGLFINSSGTAMYVVALALNSIFEYTLSSPWNVSTASYLRNLSVASQTGTAIGLFFNSSGTAMYVFDDTTRKVYQYSFEDVVTPPTDSCVYSSGNWDLMCSDNCSFSSNININGNVSISGAGNVTFNSGGIWNFTTKGNYVFINKTSGNACQLNIYPGAGWNR